MTKVPFYASNGAVVVNGLTLDTINFSSSVTKNMVLAAPAASSGSPTFRILNPNDLPIATQTSLGGIVAGNGLTINTSNGTLALDLSVVANNNTLAFASQTITATGTINLTLPAAENIIYLAPQNPGPMSLVLPNIATNAIVTFIDATGFISSINYINFSVAASGNINNYATLQTQTPHNSIEFASFSSNYLLKYVSAGLSSISPVGSPSSAAIYLAIF